MFGCKITQSLIIELTYYNGRRLLFVKYILRSNEAIRNYIEYLKKNMKGSYHTYSLSTTTVFANPVTIAFVRDEFMLTGPSPANIFNLFNFIGSICKSSSPSMPAVKRCCLNVRILFYSKHHIYLLQVFGKGSEYFRWNMRWNCDLLLHMF